MKYNDKQKDWFITRIKEYLKYESFNEEEQYKIDIKIAEINTYCEFDTIIEAIEYFTYEIEYLENKDKHNENRIEDTFYKTKDAFIKELKKTYHHHIAVKLEKLEYIPNVDTKEEKLKKTKENLFHFLVKDCKTGKKRATEITNILNFLKKNYY